MESNELATRLKELRAAKARGLGRRKIPQREVATHLHISPGAYGSWESGRTRPNIDLLPRIAEYFEVSIDDLLGHPVEVQAGWRRIITEKDLHWKLRRRAETPEEEKGIEVWRRLVRGESPEVIAAALKIQSPHEVERHIQDVVYADLISVEHLPQDADLAERVRQAFGLREVMVVPVDEEAPVIFRSALLGEAARSYFKAHVSEGMKVGLAGGYSVSRLVYSLRRGECRSIEVYPLAISPVIEAIALDANSLVGALAYRHDGYDVRGYTLQYASPLDWKEAKADTGRKYAATRRILAKAKSVDIAFMGLGVLGRRRAPIDLLGDLLETEAGLEELRRRGAVGDILYHLVDRHGQPVSPEISNLICSIDLQDLREMVQVGVRVVAIASAERKVEGTSAQKKAEIARTAIKAGYANVFIIDDGLARALLEPEQPG